MYRKSQKNGIIVFEFALLDVLCLQIAFFIAYIMRHGFGNPYGNDIYRNAALFITLADVALVYIQSTFKDILHRNKFNELKSTLKHCVILILITVLYLFSVQNAQDYSRITFFIMGILYPVFAYFSRLLLKRYLRNHISDKEKRSILIITSRAQAEAAVSSIGSDVVREFNVHGIVLLDGDENSIGETLYGAKVVSDVRNIPEYLVGNYVDEVMIINDGEYICPDDIIQKISMTGVVIHLNINFPIDMYGKSFIIEKISDEYTVATSCIKAASDFELVCKRLMDIIVGFVGCIVTAVLCIFIAPAIKIASPGPLFFAQKRVGKNGRIFKMYKFRSMVPDADSMKKELEAQNKIEGGLMFKMDFDPRVIGNKILPDGTKKTGIGEFLRKTSLDEFPQFFNVLTGSMSLVGTRPPTINEYNEYSLHHKARLAVKPGITGMWQSSGRSEITDFEEVVRLDTEYINNWSLGLDIKIILKTIKSVIKHEGAM